MTHVAPQALPSDTDLAHCILACGIETVVSVPCSITAGLHSQLSALDRDGRLQLLTSTHEANLVGLAAGIWFGTGRPALIHLQNSGLPNIGDGIVSFAHPWIFAIPLAALITYRGASETEESEPHLAIGERTDGLVSLIFGQDSLIAGDRHGLHGVLDPFGRALRHARAGGLAAFKLSPHGFRSSGATEPTPAPLPRQEPQALIEALRRRQEEGWRIPTGADHGRLDRDGALAAIRAAHPGAAMLFCNGYTSRAAQAGGDRASDFFNVGYMGGTLAIGWALARCCPELEVVVVDGDQNAQMSAMKDHLLLDYPANLHWYILDNGIGASVGGPSSLPLSPLYRALARVIPTREASGPFPHPRVGLHGSEGPCASLAPLAQRFRAWIAGRSAAAGAEAMARTARPPTPAPLPCP
ncbi:MAG: hypothetical protein ACKOZT_05645 [Cyanobium sp.]